MNDSALSADTMSPIAAGIRSRLSGLSPQEAPGGRTILGEGDGLLYLSASEVSALADAALSTVVRTCQALGFKGFQDLKLSLAREDRPVTAEAVQGRGPRGDSPTVVRAKLRAGGREAVALGIGHVLGDGSAACASAVSPARRVLCSPAGTSAR